MKYLYFKPRVSGSKPKSSGDVAGTAKKHPLMYCTTVLFIFAVLFGTLKGPTVSYVSVKHQSSLPWVFYL